MSAHWVVVAMMELGLHICGESLSSLVSGVWVASIEWLVVSLPDVEFLASADEVAVFAESFERGDDFHDINYNKRY